MVSPKIRFSQCYPRVKNDSDGGATPLEILQWFHIIVPLGKFGIWSCFSPTSFISQDSSTHSHTSTRPDHCHPFSCCSSHMGMSSHPLLVLALLSSSRPFLPSPCTANHPLLWASSGLHYPSWDFLIIIATLHCNSLFVSPSPPTRLKSLRVGSWVLITFISLDQGHSTD